MTKIACVAVVKDEGRHIAEWIAYQFVIGFDTVIILDNLSTDETKTIAAAFLPRWDVRVLDAPFTGPDFQKLAYEQALAAYAGEFEWMAFFDADEFLVLDDQESLPRFLARYPDARAIAVNWAMFGSSGHDALQAGLTIETYLHRGTTAFDANRHIKSIVKPSFIKQYLNPHIFEIEGSYIDLAGRPLECEVPGIVLGWPDHLGGRLNHYFTRSREDWRLKLQRGYRDTQRLEGDFNYYNCNDVFDDAAARRAFEVKAIMQAVNGRPMLFAAVVLMVKNEASDIWAWLAWYDLLGFDAFIIFDDDSDDGTWEILQEASRTLDIRLLRSMGDKPGRYEFRQEVCYRYALDRHKDEFEWLAFFDVDEYLYLSKHDSIRSFLNGFANADSVSVNWCNYGSSGHVLKPQVTPVEAFTWHSNENQPVNRHVKAIVRPARVGSNWIGVHCFDVDPEKMVLANGRSVDWGPTPGIINTDPDWQVAKLMHFQCRSMEHFVERIKKRPDLADRPGIFRDSDFAQVQDIQPAKLGEKLRANIEKIRAPGSPRAREIDLLFVDKRQVSQFTYVTNPIDNVGFVIGWEAAALGNRLSTFANLVALAERNNLITAYRQIMQDTGLFGMTGNAAFYVNGQLPKELFKAFDEFASSLDQIFLSGFETYARDYTTIRLDQLPNLEFYSGIVVFVDYKLEFRDLSANEENIRRFCRRGNGIVLAGAYWHQYLDMRVVTPQGSSLKKRLKIGREDAAGDRALAMLATGPDALRIGIHIRRHSHYQIWLDGRYYFSTEQYAALADRIHRGLEHLPHCFFISSDQPLDLTPFRHLPIWYEAGSAEDDFIALSKCHYVVGPPSTFGTWSAFLGGAKRLVITAERLATLADWEWPLDDAVEVLFPTGAYLPGDPAARPV